MNFLSPTFSLPGQNFYIYRLVKTSKVLVQLFVDGIPAPFALYGILADYTATGQREVIGTGSNPATYQRATGII